MEKLRTLLRPALVLGTALALFSGCSKTAAEPEIQGPRETIVLPLVDKSNQQVGSLYIDDMNGRAQARIELDKGHYTAGQHMKANVTLTNSGNRTVYAHCTDVDGNTGRCSTFPIKVLEDNTDAMFGRITSLQGIEFNVLDRNNNVFARSTRHAIVIDN